MKNTNQLLLYAFNHNQSLGSGSRKGSGTNLGSDTASESDSQPPTAGTSLLDVSHRSQRKRSGSRGSLGNRAKSLRLTSDQKCGIATREMERLEMELAQFRLTSRRQSTNAMAEIDERMLRLDEIETAKVQVYKGLNAAAINTKGDRFDYDKVIACLKGDLFGQTRLLQKLKTKNGVVSSQIRRLLSSLKIEQSASDESGPVDLDQLQLENANYVADLDSKNREVIKQRKSMATARRRKNEYQMRLNEETERRERMNKEKNNVNNTIKSLENSMQQVNRNAFIDL